MRVLVAGQGPVGRALGASLAAAGTEVIPWSRSSTRAAGAPAEVAILAVSDGEIGAVAQRLVDEGWLGAGGVALHTAGAVAPSRAFASVAQRIADHGLLHPLRAFPRGASTVDLAATTFAICGGERARACALELVGRLGGHPLVLNEAALPRYHAAAALAANHTLALVAAAIDLLAAEGLDRGQATRSVSGLLASVAHNVERVGLPAALTGPISRGDVDTVARHVEALEGAAREIYLATAPATVALAALQGRAPTESLEAIRRVLSCQNRHDPPPPKR